MNKEAWNSLAVHEQLAVAIANARLLHFNGKDKPSYLEQTLTSRTEGHPSQNGSYFTKDYLTKDGQPASLESRIFGDDELGNWVPYTDCPNLAPNCVAFKLDLMPWNNSHNGGYGTAAYYGMIDLQKDVGRFDDNIKLEVADPKKTGYASFLYHKDEAMCPWIKQHGGLPVNFAVAIVELGSTNLLTHMDCECWPVLATVHPGDPTLPSQVEMLELAESNLKEGDRISIAEAKKLGVRYVKIA